MTRAFWIGVLHKNVEETKKEGLLFMARMGAGEKLSTVRGDDLVCIRANGTILGYGVIIETGFETIEFHDDEVTANAVDRVRQELIRRGITGPVDRHIQDIDETKTYYTH